MSEYTTPAPADVKRLERSNDRLLAGVAGGLGRYFDLNPAFFRVGFAVLTLLGGAGVLAYITAVLVIPAEGESDSIAARILRQRRERPWPVVGLGLAAVALLVLVSRATFWPVAGAGWAFVLIAGLVILWTSDATRGRRRMRVVVATLVTIAALILAACTAALVLAFTWFHVSLGDGIGDRSVTPVSVEAIQPAYALGVGNLRLDLSAVDPSQPKHIEARVGIGSLRLVVPAGTRVNAQTKVGTIHAYGSQVAENSSYSTGPGEGLVVDARVGAGRIDIVRAVR